MDITNNINRYTFTTPFRNYANINTYTSNNTDSNTDTNSNINTNTNATNTMKSSSDYKKYRNSEPYNLSSLYPLPYASPTLFKSKNTTNTNNRKYPPEIHTNNLKIPLSSEYWRSRLKRRDIKTSLQPLLLD